MMYEALGHEINILVFLKKWILIAPESVTEEVERLILEKFCFLNNRKLRNVKVVESNVPQFNFR